MNEGFSDQEVSLIPGTRSPKSFLSPVSVCFIMKNLPFISYFFLSLLGVEDSVISVITLIFLFIEFMFIKYVSGFNLVGLKWSIDLSSMSFRWYSKPEPFVPILSNTNFFWMSFFIFLVIWLICFFIAFFTSTKIKAITSLTGFICEGVNFYMFSKAHNYAKKQVEKAVLNSIQDDVHFDFVPETDLEINYKENTTNNQQKNESYFLPKKTSKVLDTTSVELPPPLMPVKTTSENKTKSEEEEDKEKVISNPDHEISNDNSANTNDNIDDKENDDKNNDEDDIDFY